MLRFWCSWVALGIAVWGVFAWAELALAQAVRLEEPSANRFYAAPGRAFLMVDHGEVSGEFQPYLSVMFDHAHRPMVLDNVQHLTMEGASPKEDDFEAVGGVSTLQANFALALAKRLQVGLNLPVVLNTFGASYEWRVCEGEGGQDGMSQNCDSPRIYRLRGGSGSTLGDPRVHLLLNLLDPDQTRGFALGVAGWITFPLAQAMLPGRYAGEPGVAVGGHMVASIVLSGFRASLNLGATYRPLAQIILREGVQGSARSSEATWGV
ncbi:MAG: hypothetical protein N2515_03090, partial [Deltaproteobacteria bacterium]|nr:hypothetical protein [Deltaproteobacteria bacterium]